MIEKKILLMIGNTKETLYTLTSLSPQHQTDLPEHRKPNTHLMCDVTLLSREIPYDNVDVDTTK